MSRACAAVGGTCGQPCVVDWDYCARHLQADQVAATLLNLRRAIRSIRIDVEHSRLRADRLRAAVVERLIVLESDDEPLECRCTNPIEPSAMCPVHGIRPGDSLVSTDGTKVKFGGSR